MSVSPLLRPLGIIASILGMIQGLTWTILATMIILLYAEAGIADSVSRRNIFNNIAYEHFFRYDMKLEAHFAGTTIFIFGLAYCVFSFIWAVISIILFWSFLKEKYEYARLSYFWAVIAAIITCLDVTTIILIAIDMQKLESHYNQDPLTKYMYRSVVGIAMTIAARGYVLLIINVIVATYLTKLVKTLPRIPKPVQSNRPINRPLYYLYSTYHYPNVINTNENPPPSQQENSNNSNNQTLQPIDKPEMRRISNQTQNSEDSNDIRSMSDFAISDIGPYIPPPDYDDDDNPRWGELKRMRKAVIKPQSYN
nr:uncharacterized protein LOC111425778 [Onthophagus taurus]